VEVANSLDFSKVDDSLPAEEYFNLNIFDWRVNQKNFSPSMQVVCVMNNDTFADGLSENVTAERSDNGIIFQKYDNPGVKRQVFKPENGFFYWKHSGSAKKGTKKMHMDRSMLSDDDKPQTMSDRPAWWYHVQGDKVNDRKDEKAYLVVNVVATRPRRPNIWPITSFGNSDGVDLGPSGDVRRIQNKYEYLEGSSWVTTNTPENSTWYYRASVKGESRAGNYWKATEANPHDTRDFGPEDLFEDWPETSVKIGDRPPTWYLNYGTEVGKDESVNALQPLVVNVKRDENPPSFGYSPDTYHNPDLGPDHEVRVIILDGNLTYQNKLGRKWTTTDATGDSTWYYRAHTDGSIYPQGPYYNDDWLNTRLRSKDIVIDPRKKAHDWDPSGIPANPAELAFVKWAGESELKIINHLRTDGDMDDYIHRYEIDSSKITGGYTDKKKMIVDTLLERKDNVFLWMNGDEDVTYEGEEHPEYTRWLTEDSARIGTGLRPMDGFGAQASTGHGVQQPEGPKYTRWLTERSARFRAGLPPVDGFGAKLY
jgi:hypothetical protein